MFAFSWQLNIKTCFENQRVNDKEQFGVTAIRICRNYQYKEDSYIEPWSNHGNWGVQICMS